VEERTNVWLRFEIKYFSKVDTKANYKEQWSVTWRRDLKFQKGTAPM
jgi:hypothetical protein